MTAPAKPDARKNAFRFILLMGIVSLFGDITYEGGRSIYGPYLALLGAGAGAVGFVSGFGEFLAYGLRLVSGLLSDRTERYWLLTFLGYALIFAVPFLAFAGSWETAALCIFLERAGKAIRSPARDTILSHAARQVGRGLGFGIHEALDQIGGIIGPLVFTAVFLFKGDYRTGLLLLFIPAIMVMITLAFARVTTPSTQKFEEQEHRPAPVPAGVRGIPASFWLYTVFIFITVAGFINFPLISYHLKVQNIVPDVQLPVLYAIAMGVDGLAGLMIGRTYDLIGTRSLLIIPFLTLPIPFLAISSNYYLAIASMFLWGAVMGSHETIMRAAVADLVPTSHRGTAYGIFNTAYGAAFFLGSTALGFLYGFSPLSMTALIVAAQLLSIPVFFMAYRRPSTQA